MRHALLLACLVSLSAPVLAQRAPARSLSAVSRSEDARTRRDVLLRLVSDAQAYFLKPAAFGGGENSFAGVSLKVLEYPTDTRGRLVRTPAGATHTYTLTPTDGGVVITAASDRDADVLRAVVQGPTLDDIAVNF